MIIGTKCQYALRAVYEICRSGEGRVLTIGEISRLQRIPQRYLEGILNQLQKGKLLEAQRGRYGGYRLARSADRITLGDVVRLIEGPIRIIDCVQKKEKARNCPLSTDCVFLPTWESVQQGMDQVLESTTFAHLLERDQNHARRAASDFII